MDHGPVTVVAQMTHGPGMHGAIVGIAIALVVVAVIVGLLYRSRGERRRSADEAESDRGPGA